MRDVGTEAVRRLGALTRQIATATRADSPDRKQSAIFHARITGRDPAPSDIRRPITVWQGADDTWLPMRHALRLTELLPRGDLRIVPDTGHALPLVIAEDILHSLAPNDRMGR